MEEEDYTGLTYEEAAARVLGVAPGQSRRAASQFIEDDDTLAKLDWLGLFGDDGAPPGKVSPLDLLTTLLVRKCAYAPGERDMVVLYHEIDVELEGKRRRITSSLVAKGEENGDSAMARTVGLPAAAAVRLLVEGRLTLTGVRIPVEPEIYEPILLELERLGIACREESYDL